MTLGSHVRTVRFRTGRASVTIIVTEGRAEAPYPPALEARVICDGAHVGTWGPIMPADGATYFRPRPARSYAWDSDGTMAAIVGFIGLRPGDTDPEYFDTYTPAMRAFAEAHGEALTMAAEARWGRA